MTKIIVFGGSGLVGSRFTELNKDNFDIYSPLSSEVDITKSVSIAKYIEKSDGEVVINFAAYTSVEEAESQKDNKEGICYKVNAEGAKNIADACKSFGKYLIHISTEYVFDGIKSDSPYTEEDKPNPMNWYGATKYFGEQFVLESGCGYALIRISMPYSAHYDQKDDVARFFLGQLKDKNKISAIEDQNITPTLVDDIANALTAIVVRKPIGIYHVAATNHTTPLNFVTMIAQTFNIDTSLITAITLEEYNQKKLAKLLKNSWLNVSKFRKDFDNKILHTIEEEIKLFKSQIDSLR